MPGGRRAGTAAGTGPTSRSSDTPTPPRLTWPTWSDTYADDPGGCPERERRPTAHVHRAAQRSEYPRLRAPDHRPRTEDPGAARTAAADRRLLPADPAPRAQGAQAAEGGLRRPHGAAEGAAVAAPGAPLHDRLHP